MAGTTALPPSLLRRRCAAADLHPCSSRVPVNPALMAIPVATKRPKRPMSVRDGQPPAKRARGACSGGELLHVAIAAKINSSSLPCPGTSSGGEDPRSPARRHPSATKNPVAGSPEAATQSKPPVSMRELIQNARLAMARAAAQEEEAGRRRDIERSRAEARREVERMVDTVQFNDPWIDPSDVTKSPEELLRARQEAWRCQSQLMAMARQRDMHGGWW